MVFHVSLLQLALIDESLRPPMDNDTLRPPPDIIDEHEEYEVESILDHRYRHRKKEYLVKWKGYSADENMWEPTSNLRHARDAILDYEHKGRVS